MGPFGLLGGSLGRHLGLLRGGPGGTSFFSSKLLDFRLPFGFIFRLNFGDVSGCFFGLVIRVICAGFGLHFGRYFSGYLEVMLVLVDIFWKMLHPTEVSQIAVRSRVERLEK